MPGQVREIGDRKMNEKILQLMRDFRKLYPKPEYELDILGWKRFDEFERFLKFQEGMRTLG